MSLREKKKVVGATLFRCVHGWPMVLGVPVQGLLALLFGAVVSIFSVSFLGDSFLLPCLVLGCWFAIWGLAIYACRLDPADVGARIAAWKGHLLPVVDSFSPESSGLTVEEDV